MDVLRRCSPPTDFDCSICDWEYEFSTSLRRQHFLCIEPSGLEFCCVHLLQFFNVCDHPPADNASPSNTNGKTFAPKLMQSRLVFRWNRVTFDRCSRRDNWSVEWFSEPPFIGCLSIRQEILNVSQIAVAFHRIRQPFVTQTGLQ